MKSAGALVTLIIALVILLDPGTANAQGPWCSSPNHCTGIMDFGDIPCIGCQDTRPDESCSDTCFCGTCNLRGSSGECCGRIYYVPNFYPASGDCTGECLSIPVHAKTHRNRKNSDMQYNADLRHGYAPGLIVLTSTRTYREPLFIYAHDRCRHAYRLIAEEDQPASPGGM